MRAAPTERVSRAWRRWGQVAGFAALYGAATGASHWFSASDNSLATFWIPSGLFLAALLRSSRDEWLALVLAGLAANIGYEVVVDGRTILAAAGFSIANVAEAVTGAVLIARFAQPRTGNARVDPRSPTFRSPSLACLRTVLVFSVVSCGISSVVGGVIGAAVIGALRGGPFADHLLAWWIADAVGILIVAPPLLVTGDEWRGFARQLRHTGVIEPFVGAVLLVGISIVIFWTDPMPASGPVVLLPVLLWATLRFGTPGTAIAMVVLSMLGVLGTNAGHGAFSDPRATIEITGLQGFLTIVSLCFLSLAAVGADARRSASRLDELNRSLASEVERQTASLSNAVTQLRLALHGAEMGTWRWVVGTKVVESDERQRELLAMSEVPRSREAGFATIHPDDRVRIEQEFAEWLTRGGQWAYEHRVDDGSGRTRWIAGRAMLVQEADGTTVATGITFDITAQKLAEHARTQAAREIRRFADAAPATLWATDRAGATTFRSRDWYALTGQPADTHLGLDWLEVVHPDDRDRVREALLAAHRDVEPFSIEYRVRLASGEYGWVLDSGRPYRTEPDGLRGFVGSLVEITALKRHAEERRLAEEALRTSNERFRQLADGLDAGLWMLEANNTRMRYASKGFRRVWNFVPGKAGDGRRRWAEMIDPGDRGRVAETFSAFLAGQRDYDIEYRIHLPDGQMRWVHDRAFAVERGPSGTVTLVAGLCVDVTERRAVEQALRDADRHRSEFLTMLAHELRNPLAPVRSAAEVLRSPGATEETRDAAAQVIERQVSHIVRMVDDLLDESRLAHGRLEIQRSRVDLAAVVREALHDYGEFFEQAGLTIAAELPDAPVWVEGDPTRLAQILGNLLHNARKFTPAGGRVTVTLGTDANGRAVLQVSDTGQGIEETLLPRIFEPFTQAPHTLDRSPGGLGLGLSLVRGLVRLHDGEVDARSGGIGTGASLIVRLPLADAPAAAAAIAAPTPAAPFKILIIEDSADAAAMLRAILQFEGHEVRIAPTGREGLQLATQAPPDLVLCDLGLPGQVDGFAVARALRAWARPPYLVALTGYAGDEHRQASAAAGFHQHLAKPVRHDDLVRLCASLDQQIRRSAAAPTPSSISAS